MGFLKKSVFVFLAIAFTSVATAHSAPDLLFNYHFVGTGDLFKTTNAATLKNIWELPESVTLRGNVLDKLSRTPEQLFGAPVSGDSEAASLIRPLLDDLLVAESLVEVRRGTTGPGEVVIAVRLTKEQAARWDSNLQKVVTAFTKAKSANTEWEKFNGWEVKQAVTPNLIRSIWTGNWLVLGIGQNELPLQNNMLRRLASGNSPADWKGKTNWLEATIDFPRLQTWLPLGKLPLKPAMAEIALSNKDGNTRTVLRAIYPEPLNWKPQQWQIPTNIIRDPLISFTASQNFSALLKNPGVLDRTGNNPLTNQFYIWSQAQLPFMTFGAMPVKDSKTTFNQLADRLPKLFNQKLEQEKAGNIVLSTNKESIVWSGLSMIAPHLLATNEAAGQFIFAGLFPPPPSREAPPRELIEQVSSRTNLVYYDWEITQHRLGHWQMLSKMLPLLAPKRYPIAPELIAQAKTNQTVRTELSQRILHERWQSKVAPFLGNTITEVTLVAPNEIEMIRRSHIGFTGFELLYLSNWLNDPRFPLFREPSAPPQK